MKSAQGGGIPSSVSLIFLSASTNLEVAPQHGAVFFFFFFLVLCCFVCFFFISRVVVLGSFLSFLFFDLLLSHAQAKITLL